MRTPIGDFSREATQSLYVRPRSNLGQASSCVYHAVTASFDSSSEERPPSPRSLTRIRDHRQLRTLAYLSKEARDIVGKD